MKKIKFYKMLLITSAAYISGDLATEYGKTPPAFLPLQNKRLFEHQLNIAGNSTDIVLSLPKGFIISEIDLNHLTLKRIRLIYVPEDLNLGQSIVYVLNVTARYYDSLKILHGDTLFTDLPEDLDVYAVSIPSDNYVWANAKDHEGYVYSGYFSFSNQSLFLQALTESNYDFVKSLHLYRNFINVKEIIFNGWFDFGHVNTYYRSKAGMTTQRKFNDLGIDGFSVKKFSSDFQKIQAESDWFVNLPVPLKKYLPAFWKSGSSENKKYYEIEYFYLSTLSELFTFGHNPYFIWERILNACNEFIMDCRSYKAPAQFKLNSDTQKLYGEKTLSRLKEFSSMAKINLDNKWVYNGTEVPSLREIVREMNELITDPSYEYLTIIHGDFCFSNIFYNFRTHSIKVIDPRGIDAEGKLTIYGDIRYDIAKLAHSVLGLYDLIIAGNYIYTEKSPYDISFTIPVNSVILKVQEFYKHSRIGGLTIIEACTYPIIVHLFLSMLPLHSDEPMRQKALLANAIRLYLELSEVNKN